MLVATALKCVSMVQDPNFPISLIEPSGDFSDYELPPAPDYAQPGSWGALPQRDDAADVIPKGADARDRQADAAADLFYVHPTAYFSPAAWNAGIDNEIVRFVVDAGMLAGQASAFNEVAKVYAPRYRVMTLGGYTAPAGPDEALDLAYSDVRRAFIHYLEHWNDGRPILIASHSQGTQHATRLLAEFFREGPLPERLVVAYLIGFGVSSRSFDGRGPVDTCQSPDDTGCVVSWMTFGEGGDASLFPNGLADDDIPICTNPLSWRTDGEPVGRAGNPGSVYLDDPDLNVVSGVVGARCENGRLWIESPAEPGFDGMVMPGENYHAWDYALFYMSLRQNAQLRVASYLNEG